MVIAEFYLEKDIITFKCPECGYPDIIYIDASKSCALCRRTYKFSIPALMKSISERCVYHKFGVTSEFDTSQEINLC